MSNKIHSETILPQLSVFEMNLNHTEGKNRIRFDTVSNRLQRINTDVVHRVKDHSNDIKDPDTGNLGCYFQDELIQCARLDTSRYFKRSVACSHHTSSSTNVNTNKYDTDCTTLYRFAYQVTDYVQSLPELLYHKDTVVNLILKFFETTPANELKSFFLLIGVLAKYVALVSSDDNIAYLQLLIKPAHVPTTEIFARTCTQTLLR